MAALILEYTSRRYFVLFVVNVILILYTVYGYMVPGMFHHPGMSWTRVASSVSLEMSTGIFERLSQLGLTLIGSFILILAALRAFGCIDSILLGSSRIATRSPRMLPQAAVVGSFAVAAVSGSGAANAATTGSATIPVLIKAGFPRVVSAAVETASSLGGQLMPPLMGIAAFLMAEYLGTSYFEVVARGFVRHSSISSACHSPSTCWQHAITTARLPRTCRRWGFLDKGNILAYFVAVGGLIYMMGYERRPAMTSAQNVFMALFLYLAALFLIRSAMRGSRDFKAYRQPVPQSDPLICHDHLGADGPAGHAWHPHGYLHHYRGADQGRRAAHGRGGHQYRGDGARRLRLRLSGRHGAARGADLHHHGRGDRPLHDPRGLDPWVVHFFAFFVAVFGELSPPTSVTAAVTSRIADAPFVRTMMVAMLMCMPLMVMMAAVFSRPELVVTPGWAQMPAFAMVLVGTLALSFAFQGRFHPNKALDLPARGVLILLAALVILWPGYEAPIVSLAAFVVAVLGFGLFRMRRRYIDDGTGEGGAGAIEANGRGKLEERI
jgi:TRAP-type uncharacterized transport system fused permease subunit